MDKSVSGQRGSPCCRVSILNHPVVPSANGTFTSDGLVLLDLQKAKSKVALNI